MGFKKEKKDDDFGPAYASLDPKERVERRHKVWSQMSVDEQTAKRKWFATPCCRQPQAKRFIGTDGDEQVTCSGCNRFIKTIHAYKPAPDRSNAILGRTHRIRMSLEGPRRNWSEGPI